MWNTLQLLGILKSYESSVFSNYYRQGCAEFYNYTNAEGRDLDIMHYQQKESQCLLMIWVLQQVFCISCQTEPTSFCQIYSQIIFPCLSRSNVKCSLKYVPGVLGNFLWSLLPHYQHTP